MFASSATPDHNAAQLPLVHIFIFHMCTCRVARVVKVARVAKVAINSMIFF